MLCLCAFLSKDNIVAKISKFMHNETPSEIFQEEQAHRKWVSCIWILHLPQILKKFLLSFYKMPLKEKGSLVMHFSVNCFGP